VLEVHLGITVWFSYRRWFLLVILNLSTAIAVRTLLIMYPTTPITTWTDLHCQRLSSSSTVLIEISPSVIVGRTAL
jgi:hypothetical protein